MRRRNSPRPADTGPTSSLETILALCLCTFVALASMALIETDRRISGSIQGLPGDAELVGARAPVGSTMRGSTRPALVVLVSIDGLRPDRLDFQGYARETAPNLRAFAEDAVVFRTAAAQASHPLLSHKSILTGKYPSTLLLQETSADLTELANLSSPRDFLIDSFTGIEGTLATRMWTAGYRTAAFTDRRLSRELGFHTGFETFSEHAGGLGESVRAARRWLGGRPGARSFLFIAGSEETCRESAHEAYEALYCTDHEPHAEETSADLVAISDHYDGGVACADAQLGLLFEELRELGVFEDALIIVTSAHGRLLGERGVVGHGGLYPEELLVPLVIRFPTAWHVTPRATDEPVELVDLLPTICAATGARMPRDIDGTTLLPIVQRGVRGRQYLVAQATLHEDPAYPANPAVRAILDPGRWYAVHDARSGNLELYALDTDPLAPVSLAELEDEDVPAFLQSFFLAPIGRPGAAAMSGTTRGSATPASRPRFAPTRN